MTAKSDDHDRLEEHFFSRPPPPVVHEVGELDWHTPPRMSRGQRSAMIATVGMLGFTLLAVAAFSGFGDHFMVKPVDLAEPASPGQVLAAVSESRPARETLRVTSTARPEAPAAEAEEPSALTESAPAPTAEVPAAAPEAAQGPAEEAQPASGEPAAPVNAVTEDVAAAPAEGAPAAEPPSTHARPQDAASLVTTARSAAAPAARKAPAAAQPRKTSPRSQEVNRLIQSARRDFDRGDPQGAQRKALEAIALDPTRGYPYILLGGARDALGNPAGARSAYRDCVRQATDRQAAACKVLAR